MPTELHVLVQALREALQASGFEVEHRPFHPHVTLARHAETLPTAQLSFEFQARAVTLYSSENSPSGVRYRPLGEWPLDHA